MDAKKVEAKLMRLRDEWNASPSIDPLDMLKDAYRAGFVDGEEDGAATMRGHVINLRNLLREHVGLLARRRPDITERSRVAVEDTKDV